MKTKSEKALDELFLQIAQKTADELWDNEEDEIWNYV